MGETNKDAPRVSYAIGGLILLIVLSGCARYENNIELKCKSKAIHINYQGAVTEIQNEGIITKNKTEPNDAIAGIIKYGNITLHLNRPAKIEKTSKRSCCFTYLSDTKPQLQVQISFELLETKNSAVLKREIAIQSRGKLTEDLEVSIFVWPGLTNDNFLPCFNGTAGKLTEGAAGIYCFAGAVPREGIKLAIPMATSTFDTPAERLTIAADPYFSTLFTSSTIEWKYPKEIGLENGLEKRRLFSIFHKGAADDAVNMFYEIVVPDVAPGPKWLHDIAMVDYDYMSDSGKGWFNDINALSEAIPKEDRDKVFLCLHGWYDWVGRYCFDVKTKKLDRQWTVFGNYEKQKNNNSTVDMGGVKVSAGFPNCTPVSLTLRQLHERIAYAKSRGFKVGLYFADGANAGMELPDFTPKRLLREGGWDGPDCQGKTYCQNPLNPDVLDFYLNYTDAILDEFGKEADAFVWDETATVQPNSIGTKDYPGYAGRAMMSLVRQVCAKVENYNLRNKTQTAILASDCAGIWGNAPYAIVAHGTYQDTWCKPDGWSYCIFPNYRNVAWSCCWCPVSKFDWVEFGVRQYQAPVSISNGWGDNTGFSEMSPDMREKILKLFNWRKNHPTRLKYFTTLPVFKGN